MVCNNIIVNNTNKINLKKEINWPISASVSKNKMCASGLLVFVRTPWINIGEAWGLMSSAFVSGAKEEIGCWLGIGFWVSFCWARFRNVARLRRFRACVSVILGLVKASTATAFSSQLLRISSAVMPWTHRSRWPRKKIKTTIKLYTIS